MENICQILKVLFVETKSDDVIESWLQQKGLEGYLGNKLDIDLFSRQLSHIDPSKTLDQGNIVGRVVKDKYFQKNENDSQLTFCKSPNVFNVLLHYSSSRLTLQNNTPICKYKDLLSWHQVTRELGEDLFVTSYLASLDILRREERIRFDWKSCVGHNATELNEIFSGEMMDIHAHLKGSSYNVDLNWIYLMNHIGGHERQFKEFDNKILYPESSYLYHHTSRSLYVKIVIAAVIRQFLFALGNHYDNLSIADVKDLNETQLLSLLHGKDLTFVDEQKYQESPKKRREKLEEMVWSFKDRRRSAELYNIEKVLKCTSFEEIDEYLDKIQTKLDLWRHIKGRKFYFRDLKEAIPDYAMVGKEKSVRAILCGERRLMYRMFSLVYSGEILSTSYSTLFYIYLLIKEEFRKEMVQINQTNGFANFSLYESRKTDFIPENSVYDRILPYLAVGTFLKDGKNGNRYMEVRITPKDTARKDMMSLKTTDRNVLDSGLQNPWSVIGVKRSHGEIMRDSKEKSRIEDSYKEQYHYVFHFIKIFDKIGYNDDVLSILPRHEYLRSKVKKQAMALFNFRNSGSKYVKRLTGIDAANSEIFCRPEVFATAFRFLKGHEITTKETERPADLGMTYHVGEDFYDIVDGLRAVDEVLVYFNFRNGCRLGHALVLGTDVEQYYKRRNFRINATKQVVLDNVAWLYVQSERVGASTQVLGYLKEVFQQYYQEVYRSLNDLKDISVYIYYQSWLLRGDDPHSYALCEKGNTGKFEYKVADGIMNSADSWDTASINSLPEVILARKNLQAVKLYYHYHFNGKVKKVEAQGEILRIQPAIRQELMSTIYKVQLALLNQIEKYHIAIECNPTSNFKIGEMARYDEHPITKFYNKGLNTPYAEHHICVSINTDDAGVFATSLEREYSVMALALEKVEDEQFKNSPRAIMEWLDNIRKMSREQKFYKGESDTNAENGA